MWKVLIVDNEPVIRRGLRNLVDWQQYDMEIIGEAGDGKDALEIAKKIQPNIVLLDICMPKMNGLQLIENLNGILDNWVAIVITAYDEFSYAYRAIKLKVFDYLLKPISKEQLHEILNKAKEQLQKNKLIKTQKALFALQIEKNLPILRKKFIDEWVKGQLTQQEIEEHMHYLKMEFPEHIGILVIRNIDMHIRDAFVGSWDKNLILYAIHKITAELLQKFNRSVSFIDDNGCIVAIVSLENMSRWLRIGKKIEKMIEQELMYNVIIIQKKIDGGIMHFPNIYKEIMKELFKDEEYSPILLLAKSYIDRYYMYKSLSLEKVASKVQASPSYLAKYFRKQLGMTFNQYLTQVRINEALILMRDHTMKIYDISNAVGYSNQYYFSKVFKSIMGVSPKKYRDGIKEAAY